MDRLTEAELATMRAEHVPVSPDGHIWCAKCLSPCPCDAVRLLAHFAPGPVPHLAGITDAHCHCGVDGMEMAHPRHAPTPEQQAAIAVGLFGPTGVESELAR